MVSCTGARRRDSERATAALVAYQRLLDADSEWLPRQSTTQPGERRNNKALSEAPLRLHRSILGNTSSLTRHSAAPAGLHRGQHLNRHRPTLIAILARAHRSAKLETLEAASGVN
jgi:hypothetical protein